MTEWHTKVHLPHGSFVGIATGSGDYVTLAEAEAAVEKAWSLIADYKRKIQELEAAKYEGVRLGLAAAAKSQCFACNEGRVHPHVQCAALQIRALSVEQIAKGEKDEV